MTVPRIPFAYTLIDKRHKRFAEGKRDVLLTLAQWAFSPPLIFALVFGGLGVFFFLWPGIRGLARDFSVRNDWVFTEATITSAVPLQSGNHFNWHYFYTFQTEDGQQAFGNIVESSNNFYREGQRIPIRYLRSDPAENIYALEKMPKSVLYWFFIGLGTFWLYIAATPLYRRLAAYSTIRALSRQGIVARGAISAIHRPAAHTRQFNAELEYIYTSPAGHRRQGHNSIPLMYLTGDPKPGTAIAVWWTQDDAILL